jgi:glyoxylase-like metal-dependent hydrolase (beta-lactamase superfamily II)
MDHAGGAWAAAEQLPSATILVPTPALPLLQEPSRVVNLSTQLLGALASLWGPMRPIAPARLRGVNPQERVELGDGVVLRFEAAPGHTADQMAVVEEGSGMIFPSDICGMYYPQAGVVLPKGLPGQFNLATSREALQKLAAWHPAQLLLPHFGPVRQVAQFLRLVEHTLTVWAEVVRAEQVAGKPPEAIVSTLVERIPGYRELQEDVFATTLLGVTVRGFLDYFGRAGK